MEYISLTEDEFHETVDKFRSPHLWIQKDGEWELRKAVWSEKIINQEATAAEWTGNVQRGM